MDDLTDGRARSAKKEPSFWRLSYLRPVTTAVFVICGQSRPQAPTETKRGAPTLVKKYTRCTLPSIPQFILNGLEVYLVCMNMVISPTSELSHRASRLAKLFVQALLGTPLFIDEPQDSLWGNPCPSEREARHVSRQQVGLDMQFPGVDSIAQCSVVVRHRVTVVLF
jgi:hypothetical protein